LNTLKKKVVVYTENYLPSIGGLENNTALLCESLASLGFIVTLLTPQKNALKHHQFNVIVSKSLKHLFTEVRKNDLVVVNGGVSFKIIIPALMARRSFIIIYQMATLFRDIRNNNLKTRILNRTRRLLASFAKKNIGVSEYSFLELQTIFGKKNTGLLINPADPIFFSKKRLINDFHIPFNCLFAGRLIEGKGIKLLINAVRHINKEKEIIHLHIVGDGPEKMYVMEQKADYILYHPPVLKEGLKSLLNRMHLTVIPSTNHIEGSPLIMAESLVMGVPALVSSQPAMTKSIGNKNLIFDSGNIKDLVNRLTFLLEKNNYQSVKNHCDIIAGNYTYSNYSKSLNVLIDV
jgi:glycosyltransferase involved in cell wall biosynthesis